MKILIIEDEALAADKLERMILRYDPSYEVLEKLRSVESAVDWFEKQENPDVLFLDIHLLDGTCFDLLPKVEIHCPVIFTTAYDQYAIEAFQLNSVDYLLKPISYAKLAASFDKLFEVSTQFQSLQQVQKLDEVLASLQENEQYKSRFLVKSGARLIPIPIASISYFFSEDRITYLFTRKRKKYSISQSLDELEALLDPAQFFRINRQMVVQIDSIRMVHKYFKGRLKVDLDPPFEDEVLVSSRRASDFQLWLDR